MTAGGPLAPDTRALLQSAWSAIGGHSDVLNVLTVKGNAIGLLPSAVAAYPAMVAAIATSTLAIAILDAERRGAPPDAVIIDAEHVAAAAHSERHAVAPGVTPPPSFAPLSRFWRTRDGHVRTHANYPWHRDRALKVLGCEHDSDSVAAAMRERCNDEIEEAFADAGALAFAVRTPEQWAAHPHGAAVSRLPLAETLTQPSAAGRGLTRGSLLDGIRVLDLTRVIAGPVATRTLAAWGADVLRVDSPRLPENEDQCIDTLPGKRSALLDAADPHDRDALDQLLERADVVVQGYRPGALARFGLDASALSMRHPHLTVITLSAWGRSGPWAGRRGFDSLVQAPTGLAHLEHLNPETPGTLPAQVLDHATGYLAAAAAALSLASVAAGGPPTHHWLSLAQTATWLTSVTPSDDGDRTAATADVRRWLRHVPGPGPGVTVVGPPGRIGDNLPAWRSTTKFGSDEPSFLS